MLALHTFISKVYKCMGFGSVSATTSQCTVSFRLTWVDDCTVELQCCLIIYQCLIYPCFMLTLLKLF
jgi:hypothetical protein